MTESLGGPAYALETLLDRIAGKPVYHIDVDEIATDAKLAACWPCGCIARGTTFRALSLEPCPGHAHVA